MWITHKFKKKRTFIYRTGSSLHVQKNAPTQQSCNCFYFPFCFKVEISSFQKKIIRPYSFFWTVENITLIRDWVFVTTDTNQTNTHCMIFGSFFIYTILFHRSLVGTLETFMGIRTRAIRISYYQPPTRTQNLLLCFCLLRNSQSCWLMLKKAQKRQAKIWNINDDFIRIEFVQIDSIFLEKKHFGVVGNFPGFASVFFSYFFFWLFFFFL